jgi:hypothetical protein
VTGGTGVYIPSTPTPVTVVRPTSTATFFQGSLLVETPSTGRKHVVAASVREVRAGGKRKKEYTDEVVARAALTGM